MKKRYIIILIIVFILIILSMIFMKNKKKINSSEENTLENRIISEYNEESEKYEIYNEKTGEILGTFSTKQDAELELEFYREHPDYRADPPMSPGAEAENSENYIE